MRYRRWIAAPAVLAAAVMGLGGCSQREATIVDQAFKNPVSSAQMTLHMSLDGKSIFDVQGPFKSNGDKQLPSFDWDVKAPGGLKGRVVSSGKNVFVTYQGTTYAVGEDKIAKMLRRQDSSDDVGSLSELQSRFGIDLKQWFPQTSTKEDAQAAGVPTTRVSGKVDVDRVVDDFGRLMRSPEFKKQAGPGAATLPPQALDQLKQAAITAGTVVVLSDGADTGSKLHLPALTRQMQSAHIRVFTVGLRSYQFRARTLKKLSARTGASYSEATSPKGLTPIYSAL